MSFDAAYMILNEGKLVIEQNYTQYINIYNVLNRTAIIQNKTVLNMSPKK